MKSLPPSHDFVQQQLSFKPTARSCRAPEIFFDTLSMGEDPPHRKRIVGIASKNCCSRSLVTGILLPNGAQFTPAPELLQSRTALRVKSKNHDLRPAANRQPSFRGMRLAENAQLVLWRASWTAWSQERFMELSKFDTQYNTKLMTTDYPLPTTNYPKQHKIKAHYGWIVRTCVREISKIRNPPAQNQR